MPQHHKGERRAVSVRMPPELHAKIKRACADEDVSGASQYIVDIVAEFFGDYEFILERGRKEPNLPMTA